MKKIVSLILALLLLGIGCVFALEEECITVKAPSLPETYIKPDITLFSADKTLEDVLIKGWADLSEVIDVRTYQIPVSEVGSTYRGILYSNPKFYYVGGGFSYYANSGIVTKIIPDYTETDKDVIDSTLTAIDKATDEILIATDDGMTDFEKVMTVHNYMAFDYEYDYTYTNYDIRIMTTKTGVCQAYAMAFQHLMNELEIACTFVSSDEMNHAWNLVKVDGEWYHVDMTWDDPTGMPFAWLQNKFTLLSDHKIQNMTDEDDRHYGYDTKGLEANSTKYDNAKWHDDYSAVVTVDDLYYWVENGDILRSDGKVIYENLDGGDGWWNTTIYGGFRNSYYASLAERNGILYFNTDTKIMSYNPKTEEFTTLKTGFAFCRIYIFQNTLYYGTYDSAASSFAEGGSIKLGSIRYGTPRHEKGKIVARVYKETDEPICIYSYGSGVVDMETVEEKGIAAVTFDKQDTQTIFYWNENMQPLKEKEVVNY